MMRTFAVEYLPLFLIFAFAATASAQNKVPNFGLKDQNDRFTEINFPSDRPVVLIFGDRKGAGQIEGWSSRLYKRHKEEVYIFGVASLGGVPGFARGLVRRLIKRQNSFPVLLDWGGKVAGSLGYRKNEAMVVLVARNGTVLTKKHGAATDIELRSVSSEIDKQLR